MTRAAGRWLIALPMAAAVVLLGAVVMFAAVLGGASAAASCTTPGAMPATVPGAPRDLQPIFAAAAQRYNLGTRGAAILAGLTSVESGFGQNMGPSSAGAIGWTQFLPSTWAAYGVDANGDGRKDPYTAEDAIFASARYLQASGAPEDWYRALFAYNHADWYVTKVLEEADRLAASSDTADGDASVRQLLLVGDSLGEGTAPELSALLDGRLDADAVTGRRSSEGVAVLGDLLAQDDYATVIFDLGTNDPTSDELRESLARLSRLAQHRRLVLLTVNSPYDERAKNAELRQFARSHDAVTLIDWQTRSAELGLSDGIHGGYPQRAQLIADALAAPVASTTSCPELAGPAEVQRSTRPGQIVPIPGQPGQLIDERILDDVVYLIDTYRLTITAGYDLTGHAANGEHPLGLALDIVPGPTGSWDDVDRLARWAEPAPNAPRPPFRWVGYDGDANHGRGHHLHLSWNHGPAPALRPPAPWVDTFTTPAA